MSEPEPREYTREELIAVFMEAGGTPKLLRHCLKMASIPRDVFEGYIRDTKARGKELLTSDLVKLAARQPYIHAATPKPRVSEPRERPDTMISGASPTKSKKTRRTQADMHRIGSTMYRILDAENPMTVRQLFYRLVSEGVIAKTETEYNSTVVRLLSDMRREHVIPFSWIADNTRWQRKPRTYGSLSSMLRRSAETYRRALWDNQNAYVEVWLEKDALAGVLYEVTGQWDVPLMVTRGYPSLSFLYEAASAIAEVGRPAFLYYFGDYDPSGLDIPVKVERDLREFSRGADITFQRMAVTEEQIETLSLPTRPTKKHDTRSKDFVGESVEVDAIPSGTLREMVEDCIVDHIDEKALKRLHTVEQAERETLERIARENAG